MLRADRMPHADEFHIPFPQAVDVNGTAVFVAFAPVVVAAKGQLSAGAQGEGLLVGNDAGI
ncbi:hypothetical protein [Nitrosococcus wardiae]|uniref:Uncharacterized protein n=1 Tax=Nitrosococcus wardiae TaxID=1814290 RepID=A0A4P7BW81_9GAMM|nr:hypothetical protein [Nitrosococcus wardiae]QBQ53557.1 hypothetical protein E3U44_02825 [Nitrosococcus wardiae]